MSDVAGRDLAVGLLACAVLAAAMLLAPPSASATGMADIADASGDNAPTDLTHVAIGWDGAALKVSVTYTAASFGSLAMLIADGVDADRARRCDYDTAEALFVDATPVSAELSYADRDEVITAPAAWQLNTVTFTFASPELVGVLKDDGRLTCASGRTDGDTFFGPFVGRLLSITPANATEALRGLLAQRFGRAFSRSQHRWLKCPRQEIFPPTDEDSAMALCEFEFRLSSSRYRAGGLLFALVGGKLSLSGRLFTRTFSKAVKRCRIPPTKDGWVNGVSLSDRRLRASGSLDRGKCRGLIGPAGIANDLQYEAVSRYPRPMPRRLKLHLHGTNRVGFEAEALFRCRISRHGLRYFARCANGLHDRFSYGFRVVPPAPKKPSTEKPLQSCDPNYRGACLKPGVSDYDCAGGSGDGPYYVRGPIEVVGDDHYGLDSDGDGVACE
jgi:hypothetical protein